MNKIIILILMLVVIALGGYVVYDRYIKKEEPTNTVITKTDKEKIADEYNLEEDHMFTYIKEADLINFLEGGSGIVFFGFPECPWCQAAIPVLYDIAKEKNVNRIYYFNPYDMRSQNTETYQEVVKLLGNYFHSGSDGQPRLMVPDVFFINQGEIIGHENDTSDFSEGTPEEYYTPEKKDALKERYEDLIDELFASGCDCN